jgi:hypothetical protein
MKKKLTKKRADILLDIAYHCEFVWSTLGDDWEFVQSSSDDYKKELENTLEWIREYGAKHSRK